VIAIFTGTLWFVTRESIDLARKEFISAHPPKLAVRYIHLAPSNEKFEVGSENTGGSDATVTQSMIGLYNYNAALPCPPEYHKFGRKVLDKSNFSVGETQSFIVSSDLDSTANLPWNDLHFIGWAEYVDSSGNKRTLRFCRRYQAETCRFIQVDDPEYDPKDNS
jgi:hypothetical protein